MQRSIILDKHDGSPEGNPWLFYQGTKCSPKKTIKASAVILILPGTFHGSTMIPPIIPAQVMIPPPPCWYLKL